MSAVPWWSFEGILCLKVYRKFHLRQRPAAAKLSSGWLENRCRKKIFKLKTMAGASLAFPGWTGTGILRKARPKST
jgi:hypothetical protein